MISDRHLCSSVLCFREDSCGSHMVHQGWSEDTSHHWSPAVSAAASPSRRLARGHITQVGHDCRQQLCHHLPSILSYIMLLVSSVGSLRKQITQWRSSSGMQFLIRSLMLYRAELCGAGQFSVSALPGTLWWHLSDVTLPHPHWPLGYSWRGGRREQTAQLMNSTALEWRGAANSPQFVTQSWFRMGLKHATPHKCQLHRKPCKQLAYTDTQFLELIFKFNFIFYFTYCPCCVPYHRLL